MSRKKESGKKYLDIYFIRHGEETPFNVVHYSNNEIKIQINRSLYSMETKTPFGDSWKDYKTLNYNEIWIGGRKSPKWERGNSVLINTNNKGDRHTYVLIYTRILEFTTKHPILKFVANHNSEDEKYEIHPCAFTKNSIILFDENEIIEIPRTKNEKLNMNEIRKKGNKKIRIDVISEKILYDDYKNVSINKSPKKTTNRSTQKRTSRSSARKTSRSATRKA